jgi:hypothetical protein
VIGGTIGSGAGGGGGGGVEHAPFAHVQVFFGQVGCVLNVEHGCGGGGGGGGGAGGGAGPGLMFVTTQAPLTFELFWHPALTAAASLNQQLAPSHTPAAHAGRAAHSVQQSACVVAGATSRDPRPKSQPAWNVQGSSAVVAPIVTAAKTRPSVEEDSMVVGLHSPTLWECVEDDVSATTDRAEQTLPYCGVHRVRTVEVCGGGTDDESK